MLVQGVLDANLWVKWVVDISSTITAAQQVVMLLPLVLQRFGTMTTMEAPASRGHEDEAAHLLDACNRLVEVAKGGPAAGTADAGVVKLRGAAHSLAQALRVRFPSLRLGADKGLPLALAPKAAAKHKATAFPLDSLCHINRHHSELVALYHIRAALDCFPTHSRGEPNASPTRPVEALYSKLFVDKLFVEHGNGLAPRVPLKHRVRANLSGYGPERAQRCLPVSSAMPALPVACR